METVYATLITLLFSAWVWELKTQGTSHHAQAGVHFSADDDASGERAVRHVRSSPRHEESRTALLETISASDPVRSVVRDNGVRTWVIE